MNTLLCFHNLSLTPSAGGETPIAISLVCYVVTYGEKRAPVDNVRFDRMLSVGQYVGLSNNASRPNGGKACVDFFLGEQSMRILARMGEFVNRKGVYPPLADAEKIKAIEVDDRVSLKV